MPPINWTDVAVGAWLLSALASPFVVAELAERHEHPGLPAGPPRDHGDRPHHPTRKDRL